jgi:hypothetical protein
MLRQGIPAVGLVHHPFENLARIQYRHLGMKGDFPIVIYQQDRPAFDMPEAMQAKATQLAREIKRFLLTD